MVVAVMFNAGASFVMVKSWYPSSTIGSAVFQEYRFFHPLYFLWCPAFAFEIPDSGRYLQISEKQSAVEIVPLFLLHFSAWGDYLLYVMI